jgi:uncharacterized protein (DUF3084 family)
MGSKGQNLIFLISQPRAGSTMTQRILGTHPEVFTHSEPWILLHPLHAMKPDNLASVFNSDIYSSALGDFISALPQGEKEYREVISKAYQDLYQSILDKHQKKLYLDKTPRYYLIIQELLDYYPEAQFIFLWRNPAAVISSILNTWVKDSLYSLSEYKADLLYAPKLMLDGIKLLENKAFVLKYEDLLSSPARNIRSVCKHLGINYLPNMFNYGSESDVKWKYGDKGTVYERNKPDALIADNWQKMLINPQTFRLVSDYITFLGEELLQEMGYSYSEIIKIIDSKTPHLNIHNNSLSLDTLINNTRDYIIENRRLNNQLKHSAETIRQKNEQVAKINQALINDDRQIQQLNDRIKAINSNASQEKENLEKHIDQLNNKIRELNANASQEKESLEKHNDQLNNKIKELNANALQDKKRLEKQAQLLKGNEQQLKNQNFQLEQLFAAINKKDQYVAAMEEEITELKKTINTYNERLKEKEKQGTQLLELIAQKDTQLENLNNQISKQLKEIQNKEIAILQSDNYSKTQSERLQQLKEQLSESIREIEEQKKKHGILESDLNITSQKLEEFKKLNQESQKLIKEKEHLFREQKNSTDHLNKLLSKSENEINRLNEFIKNIEKSYTFKIGKAILWPARKITGR